MTQATLSKLDSDFAKHPVLVAGAAQDSDIANLEASIGFPLPVDYRIFVKRYGSAIVGPYSVYGIGAADAMADDEASAIQVTERFRAQQWPGTQESLVISMDHAGNAMTLDCEGHVHRFDHDSGATNLLAESFEEFINWCLKE